MNSLGDAGSAGLLSYALTACWLLKATAAAAAISGRVGGNPGAGLDAPPPPPFQFQFTVGNAAGVAAVNPPPKPVGWLVQLKEADDEEEVVAEVEEAAEMAVVPPLSVVAVVAALAPNPNAAVAPAPHFVAGAVLSPPLLGLAAAPQLDGIAEPAGAAVVAVFAVVALAAADDDDVGASGAAGARGSAGGEAADAVSFERSSHGLLVLASLLKSCARPPHEAGASNDDIVVVVNKVVV